MGDNKHQPIETGIDRLLNLVNEKSEISLTKAANILKVPKHVVDHWCNTLEDAGLIMTKLSWREKYILSPDSYKQDKDIKRSFMRQLKSVYASTKGFEDDTLKKQRKEIEKKLAFLNENLKKMKNYEKELENEKSKMADEKAKLCEREIKLSEHMEKTALKAKELGEKEKELEQKQKRLEDAMARLHKDMTIRLVTFTREQNQSLSNSYQKLMKQFISELDSLHTNHKKQREEIIQQKTTSSQSTHTSKILAK